MLISTVCAHPTEADTKTPWGQATWLAKNGDFDCVSLSLAPQTSTDRAVEITGTNGHIASLPVVAPSGSADLTAHICLRLPLKDPLLLAGHTSMLNVTYHADVAKGWAQSGLAVRANKGRRYFDWLGGQSASGLVRVPIDPESVTAAGGIDVFVDMRIRARDCGKAVVVLDFISVKDPAAARP